MKLFQGLSRFFGVWSLGLLVLAVAVVIGGVLWERGRGVPIPSEATQVQNSVSSDLRQTNYLFPGTTEQVRMFYQQALGDGWRYCGTQATDGCTNLIDLGNDTSATTDVYRRADDTANRGITIEIQPIPAENGQTYVTVFETRAQ